MTANDNWVERQWQLEQHQRQLERKLEEQSPEVWNQVRASIQDACNSFKQRYSDANTTLNCELENGRRIRVAVRRGRRTSDVVVSFDNDRPSIDIAGTKRSKLTITISDTGELEIRPLGTRTILTPDEASERILRPILFPDGKDDE
jgi:hypothetical protein